MIHIKDTDGPVVALAKMMTAGMELIGRAYAKANQTTTEDRCPRCGGAR